MNHLTQLYRHKLALLTDLYQLTMGYAYFRAGLSERQAIFHLFFRRPPFRGGFALAAGLQTALEYLQDLSFEEQDLVYLQTLQGNDGRPLFSEAYLAYLGNMRFECDIDAIPEGTAVFAHEPLMRVRGPLIQTQLVETALLNQVNFQTLIATKAARVVLAAEGDPVLEFGLRRAQGIDGGLSASRAAYIGGCAATSNVLAGKLFDIPVKGTHAHSWVMSFDDELSSFQHYAQAMPNNCVFLVDTYDTLQGVENAIQVGISLRQQGHEMLGIRLDSGDLAELSQAARRLLDAAGFENAAIVASNDLDEYRIQTLKQQGAEIRMWGVGTQLVTASEQAALGGVYKLAMIQDAAGAWQARIKHSNDLIKISNPGMQQVRRFYDPAGRFMADMIYNELQPLPNGADYESVELSEDGLSRHIAAKTPHEDLLVPVMHGGKSCYQSPSLQQIQAHAQEQLERCPAGLLDLSDPAHYSIGLDVQLQQLKLDLLQQV